MMTNKQNKIVLYTTTDDEREAREIAESLRNKGQKAIVERVNEMALRNDPLTPKTTNRFAVIASKKN